MEHKITGILPVNAATASEKGPAFGLKSQILYTCCTCTHIRLGKCTGLVICTCVILKW